MRERNVIENLNALDALIADAKRRKARAVEGEAPPPAYVIFEFFPHPLSFFSPHFIPFHNHNHDHKQNHD
jgi:hypothetical protein